MAGAIFFIVLVAVGLLLTVVTGTVFLLIPFVAIALGALLVPPVIAALRGTALDPGRPPEDEQPGVPSTGEASYEPVQQPRQP